MLHAAAVRARGWYVKTTYVISPTTGLNTPGAPGPSHRPRQRSVRLEASTNRPSIVSSPWVSRSSASTRSGDGIRPSPPAVGTGVATGGCAGTGRRGGGAVPGVVTPDPAADGSRCGGGQFVVRG